jgi:hypothetical protein
MQHANQGRRIKALLRREVVDVTQMHLRAIGKIKFTQLCDGKVEHGL